MALTDAIQLRLTVEKRLHYEAQAMAQGMALSTYLRKRLEQEDALLDELQLLRRAVERQRDQSGDERKDGLQGMTSALLEILLTLRAVAGPAKSDMSQREVERNGYKTWSPER